LTAIALGDDKHTCAQTSVAEHSIRTPIAEVVVW